jgi:hypothetical protein
MGLVRLRRLLRGLADEQLQANGTASA